VRLAPILANLPEQDLQRLALEHVRTDDKLARPQLCNLLETAIRSYRFVNDFVSNRQPPTFAILTLLLDEPGYELQVDALRSQAATETQRVASLVDAGELLGRERQLHLYRRALYEARRTDLDINGSEAALLAVLRREQGISQVEHFLIEHHGDFREFWDKPDSLSHEENALRSSGLVFEIDGKLIIPEDVAPAVWQTLGVDMPTRCARRLFAHVSNTEAASILEAAGSRTSGSKDVRLERIVEERIQPRFALTHLALSTLKDICRSSEASVTGNKEELIERIVAHFAEGRDQRVEEQPPPPRQEPRRLTQVQFETLFSALVHQELSDILRRLPDLRQTGTKERRIETLWNAHLSEGTLLGELMNRQLEDVLHRLGLRLGGSKEMRIDRLISHFGASVVPSLEAEGEVISLPQSTQVTNEEIAKNQLIFKQKASNPQVSLQPWLDEVLEAQGLVRCYATEDQSPTKQLKNKLSQAAAAINGLLVLILSDVDSYSKAREALIERWMSNAEWPKTLASIALAYPIGSPEIGVVIQRAPSPWASAVRSRLFPSVEIVNVSDNSTEGMGHPACGSCGAALSHNAKFCSNCGTRVVVGGPDALG